jgi:hypothetical protein
MSPSLIAGLVCLVAHKPLSLPPLTIEFCQCQARACGGGHHRRCGPHPDRPQHHFRWQWTKGYTAPNCQDESQGSNKQMTVEERALETKKLGVHGVASRKQRRPRGTPRSRPTLSWSWLLMSMLLAPNSSESEWSLHM